MQKAKQNKERLEYVFPKPSTAIKTLLEYPLTIVEAPMGYGKTTLVREHVTLMDAVVLWQKVYDSNVSAFWMGFCNQIKTLDEERAQSLLSIGFPSDSSSRYAAIALLGQIALSKETIVVIDDYHSVATPETNEFITFLVRNELPSLHLVLLTRYLSLEEVEELRLKGLLLLVQKDQLAFSKDDIQKYYRQSGVFLKDQEVEHLHALTEGWISALYLILLSNQENKRLYTLCEVDNLIEQAVYRHFSEETKNVLCFLCLFEECSLEQALFLTGNENTKQLLAEVIEKNAFVRFDKQREVYQIHAIFLRFLQGLMKGSESERLLYQRAAGWLLQQGDFGAAAEYFYQCNDFEQLLLTFEAEKKAAGNYSYTPTILVKAATLCPSSIKKQHPLALLALAFELYSVHELALFQRLCQEFTEYLPSMNEISEQERNILWGEYELLLSFTEYNDIVRMSTHHAKACELLTEPSVLLPRRGNWTFGSPSILYMFYRESGRLMDAATAIFEALPHYSKATNGNACGGEYGMQAEWYFHRGEYENASIACQKMLLKAEKHEQVSNVICALFLQARIAIMSGEPETVPQLLQRMNDTILHEKEFLLLHTVEVCQGYLYALLHQLDKVPDWLQQGDYRSDRLLFPSYAMFNIVYGRALLLRGDYTLLIGSMEDMLEVADVFPNLLGTIYTYLYGAVAKSKLFREQEAISDLTKALSLALPDKIYIPFVEHFDFLRPLLTRLQKQGHYKEEIAILFALSHGYRISLKKGNRLGQSKERAVLSARELEIAKLAADGFSNKEISQRLFISQNTVKTLLKKVFEKLEIRSRVMIEQALREIHTELSPIG